MISQKKLDELVAEFRREGETESYEQRHAEWWGRFSFELTPHKIDSLTEAEAVELYKTTGWGVKLYQRTFIESGLDRIKRALRYLLYGDAPIEERFFNVVDSEGTHKLSGVGREFASFLLCTHNNQRYGIWNGTVDIGLKMLEMTPARDWGEHVGQTYAKVVDKLKELQELGDFEDLQYVDEFLELLAKGSSARACLAKGRLSPRLAILRRKRSPRRPSTTTPRCSGC